MADLLERVQRELDERLAELRPLVEEARQLEAALAALERDDDAAPAPRATRSRSARSEQAQPAETGGGRARESSKGRSAKREASGGQSAPTRSKTSPRRAPKQGETRAEKPERRTTTTQPESDERRRRVLAIVTENPGTTAGNLALLLDTSVAAMGALLKRLEREGKVEKAEKGYRAVKGRTPAE